MAMSTISPSVEEKSLIKLREFSALVAGRELSPAPLEYILAKLAADAPVRRDCEPAPFMESDECHTALRPFVPARGALCLKRMWDLLGCFITEDSVVIADVGTSVYCSMNLLLPKGTIYVGQVSYESIGFSLPAALGALLAGGPKKSVFVVIGDGAFQMVAQELSTIIRHELKPFIFLVDNDGYTIERCIIDGPFDNIAKWKYALLPAVFGAQEGFALDARTEAELEAALAAMTAGTCSMVVAHVPPYDAPKNMQLSYAK
eukprot:m51a1_g12977 putative preprotein translocase subunit tim44 (260) ;mRNA; r:1937-2894